VNYARLDEPGLTADPRAVSEGYSDGVHWTIRAESDSAGVLSTVVTYTSAGAAASFSVLGASLHNGQLLSMWVGRERDARPFLLLRAAPVVTHATAVLASGDRREVTMSRVVDDFRLRFGGVPLPEDDALASVELSGPPGGTQVIELWRPPRLASPRLVPAAPPLGSATPPLVSATPPPVPSAPAPVSVAPPFVPAARNG
jgi:hypothetical protein